MAQSDTSLPAPQFIIHNDGLNIEQGPPTNGPLECFPGVPNGVRTFKYNQSGTLLAWATASNVRVVSTATWTTVQLIEHPATTKIFFSPKDTQIVTFSRYQTDKDHKGVDNVRVWSLKTNEMLLSFVQKGDSWVPQYSDDETIFGRLASNELQLLDPSDLRGAIKRKLYLEGIAKYSISRGNKIRIAAFVAGSKGGPAFVRIYNFPNLVQPFAQKSFFKADTVEFEWNCEGTALLVHTQVAVDVSNKSYYGENNLYYMSAVADVQCNVPLTKEGPIYETKWSPTSDEFVVVHGYMPAKAMLFGAQCKPLFDFGTGKRNTVMFSPHGNLICLAGFGNLRGEMEFWDRRKLKKVSVIQAPDSTIYSWAPDSEHLITATTSPRIRVDNGYKIWHYRGELTYKKDFPVLLNAEWAPAPGVYPLKNTIPVQESARDIVIAEVSKAGAYRPPGARGLATTFKKYTEEEIGKPQKLDKPAAKAPRLLPIGVSEDMATKAALKNKKKREAKARAQAESSAASSVPSTPPPVAAAPVEAPAEEDIGKKIRGINKKLRQINDLKEKRAAGKVLEATQLEKLQAEDELVKELAALELKQK
eukprot:Ihof_evm4s69 gene=Ihof_evmTU4s69